ncbi:MAG: RtcB family protein [Candidatus Competibacteraceae bacterium]
MGDAHSGSRGIDVIGRYFITPGPQGYGTYARQLPDRDLAYFEEGPSISTIMSRRCIGAGYALINRREMMRLILDVLKRHLPAELTEGDPLPPQLRGD